MKKFLFIFTFFVAIIGMATSQQYEVIIKDGDPVKIMINEYVTINRYSSMLRKHIIVNDSNSPLRITDGGVILRSAGNDLLLSPFGHIQTVNGVTAYQINYILFDVFGKKFRSLEVITVQDAKENVKKSISLDSLSWKSNQNEAEKYSISLAYVAKVRRADGVVWEANEESLRIELKNQGLKDLSF